MDTFQLVHIFNYTCICIHVSSLSHVCFHSLPSIWMKYFQQMLSPFQPFVCMLTFFLTGEVTSSLFFKRKNPF